MIFAINIITLFACFSAMIYCYVLSKRIQAFDNVKEGIGALIEEMIRTTNDLQTAFDISQQKVDTQTQHLQDKIDEGIAMSEYLSDILDQGQFNLDEIKRIEQNILDKCQNIAPAQKIRPERQHNHDTFPRARNETQPSEGNINRDEDVLADVVPAGFDEMRKKRRAQKIIPGEEYL